MIIGQEERPVCLRLIRRLQRLDIDGRSLADAVGEVAVFDDAHVFAKHLLDEKLLQTG